ncbi:RutC family protein [Metallosphaera sp. J1]|uniref:RidA family protein n=1 Tax=Metallosphaera javensis (ex Hofmann et al. 2022) TaxID=99938 RepID=UPI001EDE3828|nr:RidA family protein [Metallosphaera javensis (ex Hofmann et al. 2022)]MCG3108259.1 RutC family protein [Metallosphaera javensis (ex Hofmann et al. 2022)]
MKEIIYSENSPKPIGPYSQAVLTDRILFVSGQIPLDPKTNELVKGGIEEQTRQVMENLKGILSSAGMTLDNVTMSFVFLKNLQDFPKFNEVYAKYFKEKPPARVTVQVGDLPRGSLVEIAVIAYKF